jgi:hypothetical protein
MWTIFHRMDAKKWRTHSFERGIPCQLNDTAICRCIRGGSRTRRIIPQLPNGIIFRLTLKEMSCPQPKTLVHCNNATAVGIANNSIKRQRSRSMEMRFFWVGDKIAQNMYDMSWHPGMENLANYQSKHCLGSHHVKVRPWYLHMENSPQNLPRAQSHSTLKGCVGTLKNGYVRNIPLPRAPRIQSANHMTSNKQVMIDSQDTCYLQVPRVPTWSNLTGSRTGLGRNILPFCLFG